MGYRIKRTATLLLLILIALPLSRVAPESGISLPERVSSLEEFRQQQRDWNNWMDQHLTAHVDDLSKSQGSQDAHTAQLEERIRQLENRASNLSLLGALGALLLTVLFPLAYFNYSGKHNSLMKRVKVLEGIAIAEGHDVSPEVD